MRTAAGIFADSRFETNSLCLRQAAGGDNIPVVSFCVAADINSNVFDIYFLRIKCPTNAGSLFYNYSFFPQY
jgi:hypothetical protein